MTANKHIRAWKSHLRGTIITAINGKTVTSTSDIDQILREEKKDGKREAIFEFGLLTAFALNGNGVPTLQTDQLNVIAHHLNAITMKENGHVAKDIYLEFWGDPMEWPDPIDKFNISKLTRQKIFHEQPEDIIKKFVNSEWKELDRYLQVDMFGEPCARPPGSPASAHFIEVFTGESHEDVGTYLHANDEKAPKFPEALTTAHTNTTMEKILDEIQKSSPQAYTNAAAAMAKFSIQKVKFN